MAVDFTKTNKCTMYHSVISGAQCSTFQLSHACLLLYGVMPVQASDMLPVLNSSGSMTTTFRKSTHTACHAIL